MAIIGWCKTSWSFRFSCWIHKHKGIQRFSKKSEPFVKAFKVYTRHTVDWRCFRDFWSSWPFCQFWHSLAKRPNSSKNHVTSRVTCLAQAWSKTSLTSLNLMNLINAGFYSISAGRTLDHTNTWTWRTCLRLGIGETFQTETSYRPLVISTSLNSKPPGRFSRYFLVNLVTVFVLIQVVALAGYEDPSECVPKILTSCMFHFWPLYVLKAHGWLLDHDFALSLCPG